MGIDASMRFAVSLFVIAVGAILAFGVSDTPDDGVRIHVIGVILLLTGLVGLAMARQLFVSRRRTDIIYRDNGTTWLEPNAPAPSEPWEQVERRVLTPLPERYAPTVQVPRPVPGSQGGPVDRHAAVLPTGIAGDPQPQRVEGAHGVMDVEPGSEEFRRTAELYDD
jgi:hypothetical protein